jgi:hypothetical protein
VPTSGKEVRKALESSPLPSSVGELRDLGESVRGSLEDGLTAARKDLASRAEPQQQKRRRWGLWIVLGVLAAGIAVVATRKAPELPPPPPPAPRPKPAPTTAAAPSSSTPAAAAGAVPDPQEAGGVVPPSSPTDAVTPSPSTNGTAGSNNPAGGAQS